MRAVLVCSLLRQVQIKSDVEGAICAVKKEMANEATTISDQGCCILDSILFEDTYL